MRHIVLVAGEADEPVDQTERLPRVKASQLIPQARLWLRTAQLTGEELRREPQDRNRQWLAKGHAVVGALRCQLTKKPWAGR
jgi:hypothetical protein